VKIERPKMSAGTERRKMSIVALKRQMDAREKLFFRPVGAGSFPFVSHGWRRGLHSCATSRLVHGKELHP
jgi:hypothetical protein